MVIVMFDYLRLIVMAFGNVCRFTYDTWTKEMTCYNIILISFVCVYIVDKRKDN